MECSKRSLKQIKELSEQGKGTQYIALQSHKWVGIGQAEGNDASYHKPFMT